MFEVYGETMIAMVMATREEKNRGGLNITQHGGDALAWLRERHDVYARREDRLETVEWAILLFVAFSLLTDVVIMIHDWL
jgi:hypothetical protein